MPAKKKTSKKNRKPVKRTGQKQKQNTNIRINIGGDGKASKQQPSAHTLVTQSAPPLPQHVQNLPSSLAGIGELNKAINRLNALVPNYVGLGNVPPRYSRDSQTELNLAGGGYIQNDMFSRGSYNNAHRDIRFHNDLQRQQQDEAMSEITDFSLPVRTPAQVVPFDDSIRSLDDNFGRVVTPNQMLFTEPSDDSSSDLSMSFIPQKNVLTEQQKNAIGEAQQKKQTILDIMNEPESQPQVGQHDMMMSQPEESKKQLSKKIKHVGFVASKDPHIYDDLLDTDNCCTTTEYSLSSSELLGIQYAYGV